MAKIQPAALAILGILWLIQDLYAIEINQRSPRGGSDFYFDDVSTPTNIPASAETPSKLSRQRIPLQPAPPNEGRNNNRPNGNQDVAQTMNDNNPSGNKASDNQKTPEEKDVKKLLSSFVSLLLNLNDKEDGLIRQLKSYLGNENDQNPNDPGQVGASSTMSSIQPKINLTTPATTTLDDEDDDSIYDDDDEGNYYTSKIPPTTVSNVVSNNDTNVTPNPGQNRPDGSQASNPAMNNKNNQILDIFQNPDELGIIPNNEFIDDLINAPKSTPGNKGEIPNNLTNPSETGTETKPLNQSQSNKNTSDQGIKNCTKNSTATERPEDLQITPKRNEGNYSPTPQAQISSEEPWNFNPYSTQSSYQIPITPETKAELHNQERYETAKASTAKLMPLQQHLESQIPYPYTTEKPYFYSTPNIYNPQRINYDKKPIYSYESFLKQMFTPSTQVPPRFIPMPTESYNHANGFYFPKLLPQINLRHYNVPPEDKPFIPYYPNDQNTATSNYGSRYPDEKNEDKIADDDVRSDSPLKNDSNSPGENPQPLENLLLPQIKDSINDKNPCDTLPIQNNHPDDTVAKEINPESTKFALPLNPTEQRNQKYLSMAESPSSTENYFHSAATPVPQDAQKSTMKRPRIRPHNRKNRFKTPTPPSKLSITMPTNQNQLNPTTESSSQDKLDNTDFPQANEKQALQESPSESQHNNTEGPLIENDSTKNTLTSETPLNNQPQNELSTSIPANTSVLPESQQTTNAPEVETQNMTLPDDSKEVHSEESDDNYPSSEEDTSSEFDDEEHDDMEDNEHDHVDDDTLYDHADDEDDTLHDHTDDQNDHDKGDKKLLNMLDKNKVLINNGTSEIPQNSSSATLTNNSSELLQNSPVPSTDDSNKSPQNSSAATADDLNKPTQNASITLTSDLSKSTLNTPTTNKNYPAKSPVNVDDVNKNAEPFGLERPPYKNILDYIYSHSKNSFFKELREEQDKMH